MNRTSWIIAGAWLAMSAPVMGASVRAQAATAFPDFPRSPAAGDIGRWLASQTDLPLASVVLVGQGYVFSFQAPDPPARADGLVLRQVREEITSLGMASRLNGRSASASIAFDCRRNQATASDVIVFAGNSLKGDPGRSVPAADWLVANPGLYLMDLAQAACDPSFARPFAKPPASVAAARQILGLRGDEPIAGAPRGQVSATRAETGAEHWVQVGAFANAAAANHRWREIQRMLPAQSAGRGVKIEPAGRDGKTLVRALAGPFHGDALAQAFCTALKTRGGDCLVR